MTSPALVVSLLLAAPPTAPAPGPYQVFHLGIALSGSVVYRMDSMPANLNADGAQMIEKARALATKVGVPFPDDAVLKGAQSDTVAAMGYVMNARQHPISRLLQERHGRATAALFELGLVSHIALTGGVPSAQAGKDVAELIETSARDSGVPREQWIGLVEAYRNRKPEGERMDAMIAMIQTVGKSLRTSAAAAR